MVERIARLLHDREGGPLEWGTLSACFELVAEGFRDDARAVIAVMREPTDQMVSFGHEAAETSNHFDPVDIWKAMIDAAGKSDATS